MKLPQGQLVRKRVVDDLGTALVNALDSALTGYARLEAQDALLLDATGVGVLTFDSGVPVVAYHTGTDNGGNAALTDIAVAGPYRLELYELTPDVLTEIHDTDELRVPPAAPAEQLTGDRDLAARTREAAPPERLNGADDTDDSTSAVEAFLDDEEKIEAIQERAREEARERAAEWDFTR